MSSQPSVQSQRAILLVEDNEDICAFLKTALSPAFEVDVAVTAAGALDTVRLNKTVYDIFLLDITLHPGPGGVAVLKALREMDAYRHTLAIAMTGYDRDAAPEKFKDAEFDRYLRKPFYQQDLLDVINELLGSEGG